MKKTTPLAIIALFFVLTASKCKKDPVTDSNGLPAATQTGANTLGFILNGQAWTPQGYNGTANLSYDVDFGYKQGVLGINAYRIISTNHREVFGIGISDSLNNYKAPFALTLTNSSLLRVSFANDSCTFFSTDANTVVSGVISISKLDKTNRIISGTFNTTLSKTGCSNINITDGRFDISY